MSSVYPSSPEEFNRRFPNHQQNTIHSLGNLKAASGSQWSSRHLEACRVLLKTHRNQIPLINNARISAARTLIARFPSPVADLTRVSLSEVGRMGHQELRELGGAFGAFLVALADVSRVPNPISIANSRVRRNPKPIDRSEYVTGEGLSSPSTTASSDHVKSSPFTPQSQGPLEFEDQVERTKHEIVSADMAGRFVSSVLDLLSGQESQDHRIEFSKAPTVFELESPNFSCTCQDDGAIVHRKFNVGISRWTSSDSFLCSLEAKARYTKIDSSGTGMVSDRELAQQVCELLGSVMSMVEDEEYEELGENNGW